MVKKKIIKELSAINGLEFWPPVYLWREDDMVTGATGLSHGVVQTITVPVLVLYGEQIWSSDDQYEGSYLLSELEPDALENLQSRINFINGKK